ncbi:MAG: GAF domain-containing protein [Lautropia sp.]
MATNTPPPFAATPASASTASASSASASIASTAAIAAELETLGAALASPGQPDPIFTAFAGAMQRLVGHQLLTLLYVDGDEVARIFSTRPAEYPLLGRKRMGPTPWGDHVLRDQRTFFGPDKAAIRWAFFDHELIERMGLGAVINVPCRHDGAVVGTINLLGPEHCYRAEQVTPVAALAPLLVPAFLAARAAARKKD